MRAFQIVVVIALVALFIDLAPGGGNVADAALTALTMGFLGALGFFGYRMFRENQFTIDALSDRSKAVLYGAMGVLALLIAGSPKMFGTPRGTLAWIVLLCISLFAIFRVWTDATRYG